MATTEESEELLNAVKESLTRDGHMNKFKAELRAAVISVLNKTTGNQSKPPEPPEETKIVNDLIKEYLEWMGFRYSEQVLAAECGQNDKVNRKELESKLNIEQQDATTSKMPLLYHIILTHMYRKE